MAKTPRKTPSKSKKAEAGFDLSEPNVEAGLTVALVAVAGVALGGAIPTSLGACLSTLTLDGFSGNLHGTWWPYSLLLTCHVLNNVRSNNKWWVNDLTNCCFNCFSGLLIQDALKGNFAFPTLFANGEALFSLVLVCWYIVNHNIPMTEINVYSTVTEFLGAYLPLQKMFDLCSLVFELRILIGVASTATSASTWVLMPFALGKVMYSCAFVHCASQFYNQKGLSYNVGSACSARAHEAGMVAIWYATNGFAALPYVGATVGAVTGAAEGFFGGRDAFIVSVMVLQSLLGHLVPVGMNAVHDKVYAFTGVQKR